MGWLRGEIAEEQQAWKRKEHQWQQEIVLLEEESRRLDELIAREKQLSLDKEDVVAGQLEHKDELKKVVAGVGLVADRIATKLAEIVKYIPEPLQCDNISRACGLDESESLLPTSQLQIMVSALSEIESIQHSSHVVRELLTLEGGAGRREMDVVYLGLACGFAVSPDNSVAATGCPTSNGWKWTEDSAIATEVRKLVGIRQQKLPPSIVNLPVNGNLGEVKL